MRIANGPRGRARRPTPVPALRPPIRLDDTRGRLGGVYETPHRRSCSGPRIGSLAGPGLRTDPYACPALVQADTQLVPDEPHLLLRDPLVHLHVDTRSGSGPRQGLRRRWRRLPGAPLGAGDGVSTALRLRCPPVHPPSPVRPVIRPGWLLPGLPGVKRAAAGAERCRLRGRLCLRRRRRRGGRGRDRWRR